MKKYENFTLGLALFDALPVLFFCGSMLLIASHFKSIFFILGALLCTFAGCGKVLWKILIALKKIDIQALNKQLRFNMPLGFLCMLIGLIINIHQIHISQIFTFPASIFYLITGIALLFMFLFAFTLDGTKAKSNWIEQITNTIAQASLFIGILINTI